MNANATCKIDGCTRSAHAVGMCPRHYYLNKVYGDPHHDPMAHKFWAKVRKTDTCWAWVGTIQHGYGLVNQNGKRKQAHRVAYEYAKGPIPSGVVLDHLCRNRWCVNPDHLEPVTNRENVLRGQSVQADNARKDRCPQGHPYDEANTSRMPDGSRRCKRCRSDHSKAKTAEAKHQRSMLT